MIGKECSNCGSAITSKWTSNMCTECYNRLRRDKYRLKKENDNKTIREGYRKSCGKHIVKSNYTEIGKINAIAREKETSYGKIVALETMKMAREYKLRG